MIARSPLAWLLGSTLLIACDDGSANASSSDDGSDSSPSTTGETATETGLDPNTGSTSATSEGDETGTTSVADTDTSGESSSSSGEPSGGWEWDLPPGFPVPRVPEDNPMTAEKVELGRHLFYDVRLSANGTQSCSSCHEQALAFADGRDLPQGSTGDTVPLNSMALVNVAYNATHTWASPVFENLSEQAAIPLFGEDPVELGAHLAEAEILGRFEKHPLYQTLFAEAYPDADERVSWINIRRAIASFERTLISGNAPYDRYTAGDTDAMSESAIRGLNLFVSERFECHHCHNTFNLSASVVHEGTVFETRPFFNTGLYNVGRTGAYPEHGEGLFRFTGDPDDMGKFKPPTLRNIVLTGPYMHDASIATLDEVLDFYAAGGRNIVDGPNAGDGRLNPNKSSFVSGFELSEQERADFLAFFAALTDEEFISNPAIANPWK